MECSYNSLREIEGKLANDPHLLNDDEKMMKKGKTAACFEPVVVVGAGPSGLAVAACLKEKGVRSLVVERSNCIASLWQLKTYDRLRLHLPKEFCELPLMPFPKDYPTYPTKKQFIDYLEAYASKFEIEPAFNESVEHAEFDQTLGFWRVTTTTTTSRKAVSDKTTASVKTSSSTTTSSTSSNRKVVSDKTISSSSSSSPDVVKTSTGTTTSRKAVSDKIRIASSPDMKTSRKAVSDKIRIASSPDGKTSRKVVSDWTDSKSEEEGEETTKEYMCRWLIVATGENAEVVVPEVEGMEKFGGPIVHTSLYKSGEVFRGKKVLVVGSGNSGMEVCLDLCHHNAMPSIVVRDRVHVLPREMLGRSTFGLSMWLLKWLPITLVDRLLLIIAWLILGDTSKLGLTRPQMGPLQLKNLAGKTPVLDVGTLDKIKSGDIKVCTSIKRLMHHAVEFIDGRVQYFDAIILATGYKSNVPYWLKEGEMFSKKDGLPRTPFPNGWKGNNGLYAVGFTKRGLLGASIEAKRIAEDIGERKNVESKSQLSFDTSFSTTTNHEIDRLKDPLKLGLDMMTVITREF